MPKTRVLMKNQNSPQRKLFLLEPNANEMSMRRKKTFSVKDFMEFKRSEERHKRLEGLNAKNPSFDEKSKLSKNSASTQQAGA